jgi:Polyketide cyclase / dehydrase and lipid transport
MASGHFLDVDAEPDAVWRIWSDTAHWPDWNPTIKAISLDGAFATGTGGSMSTSAGRTHSIRLASVNPPRAFRLDAKPLPASTFHFDCTIEPKAGGGCRIGQSISISGLMSVFSPRMTKQVSADFPKILAALKAKAEAEAEKAASA